MNILVAILNFSHIELTIFVPNSPTSTTYLSQVYLSLFGFSVFAFTLDICFYFENIISDCKI